MTYHYGLKTHARSHARAVRADGEELWRPALHSCSGRSAWKPTGMRSKQKHEFSTLSYLTESAKSCDRCINKNTKTNIIIII